MGGYTLATANTPGFTLFTQQSTGRKFVACQCTATWLPLLEKMAIKRGIIKRCLDIIQIVGGDPASGGTHVQGAAIDVEQVGPDFVKLCREAGANASWSRYPPQFDNDHTHITLTGCPHDGPCAYQTAAQARGYNGLGQGTVYPYIGMWGYGGKDPFPAVSPRRSWIEGVTWMKQQLATPAPVAPTAPKTSEEPEVSHLSLRGPQLYTPIVVPNDGREYQIDLVFARGQSPKKVRMLIFNRQNLVSVASSVSRDLSWDWQRDVPGKVTLMPKEGSVSLSFEGTDDQILSVALTPTGRKF